MWGWVEQKGLAVELLKSAIDAVSGRTSGLRGYERRKLIAAAHSTIVVAALFESLQAHVGKGFYSKLKITDEEKISLINQMRPASKQEAIRILYTTEIPAPSAVRGFEESLLRVGVWLDEYSGFLKQFLEGLTAAENLNANWDDILENALRRYHSHYLELAGKVPEFAIWAQLGEHAATRTAVREAGDEVMSSIEDLSAAIREQNTEVTTALNANRDALNRVEALLSAGPRSTGDGSEASAVGLRWGGLSGLRQAVSLANAGTLYERIIPADPDRYPTDLTIPRVDEIYVNPRYRAVEFDPREILSRQGASQTTQRPADDRWWSKRPSRDDFDIMLTAHVTSPNATRLPLLLLGHPGAGKSLLTKVFAARLPDPEYTVVRVPLRRVSADARIHRQIEEALEISTDQRIAWSDLAEQSAAVGTVRVVLLDGLDELIQASEHDRSSYLEEVVEFQEREANQRRPVVVIATSRTVVADRVRIPEGTTIVKLDPFTDDDIVDWLGRWKRVNASAIATGTMGELTLNAVRRQPELAEQPLLLLMLALYAADPDLPALDEDIATAELYRRLLDGFARREAGKDLGLGHDPSPDELEQRVQDHLDRLAIAALGMFNRGRQDISEEELGKDLEALEPRLMERFRHAEAGRRIIGEFFFVHAPEARTIAGQQARNGQPQRAYEFLHATFGEYLVARRVMDELVDVAVRASSGRRGPTEPDDDLLFALLSHQVLAGRQSMLDFAQEIFAGLGDQVRSHVFETLEALVRTYRNRHGSDRYTAYRPVPPDPVHRLACYSANLFTLRIFLEPENTVPLTKLMARPRDILKQWQSIVTLWKSALDYDTLRALITTIELTDDQSCLASRRKKNLAMISSPGKEDSTVTFIDIGLANLAGDRATERNLRYGAAVANGSSYFLGNDPWADVILAGLISQIAGQRTPIPTFTPPPGTPENAIKTITTLIFLYLKSELADHSQDENLLQLLFKMPAAYKIDELALTAAVIGRPDLREAIPELQNFEIYGRYAEIVRRGDSLANKEQFVNWRDPSDETIAAIADVFRRPLTLNPRKAESPAGSPGLERPPGAESVFG